MLMQTHASTYFQKYKHAHNIYVLMNNAYTLLVEYTATNSQLTLLLKLF